MSTPSPQIKVFPEELARDPAHVVAAADVVLATLHDWLRLEGERPRLEVLIAHAEQGREFCSTLIEEIERSRAVGSIDDAHTALQRERSRFTRLADAARALLDELPT
jgi:hypothetical protein